MHEHLECVLLHKMHYNSIILKAEFNIAGKMTHIH